MKGYRNYNKEELFNYIDRLSIERIGDQIITKYNGNITKIANVSKIYEVFDISKYIKDKISDIEKNFTISKYKLIIKGGFQFLKLISDSVDVGGDKFYKSFYILNSSDKSRRLRFNVGLQSEDFYFINGVNNIGLSRKHIRGLSEKAEEATIGINDETFNEQIESLESIIGHRIAFSKVREVILGEGDIPEVNHLKFDSLKNSMMNNVNLTREQRKMLLIKSKNMVVVDDFYLDAFYILKEYLKLFNKKDSHIIKNESDRIMKMTQWSVRNRVLESLGI